MTWGEFKAAVDREAKDDDEVSFIDCTPTVSGDPVVYRGYSREREQHWIQVT